MPCWWRPNKASYHCPGDMAVRMRKVLARRWVGVRVCHLLLFSVFTSHVIKIKIETIQWKKSRVWDTIDDWYINNVAKNQVSTVFHPHVICRSVSTKFIEPCMETPCFRCVCQKHLSLRFAIETQNYCSRAPTHWKKCFSVLVQALFS